MRRTVQLAMEFRQFRQVFQFFDQYLGYAIPDNVG